MSLRLLPPELSQAILHQLSRGDLKALRLSFRFWTQHVNAILFETVYFELEEQSLLHLRNIADRYHLRSLVRTLALKQPQNLPYTDDIDWWTYRPNFESMRDSPLSNMSRSEQEGIFQEYQHDSLRIYSTCDQIYQRMVDGRDVHSKPHQELRQTVHPRHKIMEAALDLFEQGLEEFSRLQNFRYIPYHLQTKKAFCWRSLNLSGLGLLEYDESWPVYRDVGAMQVCYVLWCLGKIATSSSHISSLDFEIEGPAFWTPARLFYLMRQGEGWGWENPFDPEDDNFDEEVEEEVKLQFKKHRHLHAPLNTALTIVRNSFSRLTRLKCTIGAPPYMLPSMIEPLCTFVTCSPGLISLDLTFGDLVDGGVQAHCGWGHSVEQQITKSLFERLCDSRPQLSLQHLGLELITTEEDLLGFLKHFNKVLRTLDLTDIVPTHDSKEWESVLDRILRCMPLLCQVTTTRGHKRLQEV